MANDQIVLVNTTSRRVFDLSEIYDPDKHGPLENASEGLYIPEVPSLVKDENNQWYQVTYVDPSTYKSTIEILKIMEETNTELYNPAQQFMLFFDERIEPTKLQVDSRIAIYGNTNTRYRLVRRLNDNTTLPISIYISSSGTVGGDLIPLEKIDLDATIKRCTNCHTYEAIAEGEQYYLEVYDNVGSLTASIALVAKKANILNDLISCYNPVVGFDVTCNQMKDDDFIIYENQDPSNLTITPILTYADGTTELVVVDGTVCVCDGLMDFIPAFPGHTQAVLFRYFLSAKQPSTLLVEENGVRFVSCTKYLVVEPKLPSRSLKLAVIPMFNNNTNSWRLKYYAYLGTRDRVVDVTDYIRYTKPFDGTSFTNIQNFTVEFNTYDIDASGDVNDVHQQAVSIKVRPFNDPEPFVIKDGVGSVYAYGPESFDSHAPVLRFNPELEQVYFSSQLYTTVDEFLQVFYHNSAPPFDASITTVPETPTHFTLRRPDTNGIICTLPVPIDEYAQYITPVNYTTPSDIVGSTVIVEFLKKINDTYTILYGAPVPVREFTE